jgi:hypothetical protein
MADFDNPAPISLANMAIGSVDTLRGSALDQRIPNTWNDQPPLLTGPRGVPEDSALLKGVSKFNSCMNCTEQSKSTVKIWCMFLIMFIFVSAYFMMYNWDSDAVEKYSVCWCLLYPYGMDIYRLLRRMLVYLLPDKTSCWKNVRWNHVFLCICFSFSAILSTAYHCF